MSTPRSGAQCSCSAEVQHILSQVPERGLSPCILPLHPPYPSPHRLRDGHGNTEMSWLFPEWVQDASPVESNERLLLTWGQVLSKCFVRYNPVSISTYIEWKRFAVTKPIVFYLSNVYFRWYHQKAFFFPLCENTFNQFLFLEERGKKCFLKSKESASHPSSCASA